MPQFAANLSMLYPELAFLDRFDAAAKDGFQGVEYLFPYAFPQNEIVARLQANGLKQVLFNGPPGDWDGGDRGLACLPGRDAEFREGIAKAIDYAVALDCPRIHVMAGLVPEGLEREAVQAVYLDNLRWAAAEAAKAGSRSTRATFRASSSPGKTTRTRSSKRSARPTSRCRWTCTTARSSKATWR